LGKWLLTDAAGADLLSAGGANSNAPFLGMNVALSHSVELLSEDLASNKAIYARISGLVKGAGWRECTT
jgi:hypothetical protein